MPLHALFAPCSVACDAAGQGCFAHCSGIPFSGIQVETTGPPTFLGNPLVPMPCSPTPAEPTCQAITTRRRGPRLNHDEGSRVQSVFRGSITRPWYSLSTLRSAGYPDTTQDSLPAAGLALPGGFGYPQGSIERFQIAIHPCQSSSFPKLSWRKVHDRIGGFHAGLSRTVFLFATGL